MNEGVIATRYARAFLRLTAEDGSGERVCAQVEKMLDREHPSVPSDLEADISSLVSLLKANGREDLLRRVLYSYRKLWYESRGIKICHLTTVAPDPQLEKEIADMVTAQTGSEVVVRSHSDPSIEGGFVVRVDDWQMDASVRGQLEAIRKAFIDKNRRIL